MENIKEEELTNREMIEKIACKIDKIIKIAKRHNGN